LKELSRMSRVLVIEGKEIRTMSDGGNLMNGRVLIRDGRIEKVGERVSVPAGADVIEGSVVVPGLIDAHTHLGICPIESSDRDPSGVDASDPISPHLRVADALNPFDPGMRDALGGGVTASVVSAGSPMAWATMVEAVTIMPGQNAVMKMNGRIMDEHSGVKIALGDHPKQFLGSLKMTPNTRMGIISSIRSHLERAKVYVEKGEVPETEKDKRKLEALIPLLKNEYPAHIHVHKTRDILSAIRLVDDYHLKGVLIHATESYMIAEKLAEKNIPVVFGPIIFPKRGRELENLTPKAPAVLEEKGVLFAISTDHPASPIEYLTLSVGLAEAEGLKDGLKTVTVNAAKIAGVWERIGSLKPGKDGDVAVFDGDPMEAETKTLYTVVDGKIEYRGE
jgi:imidazolonepropionase-like amidohydrolase